MVSRLGVNQTTNNETNHDRKRITPKLREIKELIAGEEDFLRPLIGLVVQEVLEAEMNEALGAQKGERTEERMGYRSGYYVRNLVTRVGKLELRVPQDRQGRFSTQLFERYQRSEKALVAALAEMYVQGVSTRKVKAITEELCGQEFSASSISNINKRAALNKVCDASLRTESQRWRGRSPKTTVVSCGVSPCAGSWS
jgi:putative transposase